MQSSFVEDAQIRSRHLMANRSTKAAKWAVGPKFSRISALGSGPQRAPRRARLLGVDEKPHKGFT